MSNAAGELREFAQLVRTMRQAQRAYFRTRESKWLDLSKQIETEVDRKIEDVLSDQRKLFPDQKRRTT